MDRIHAILIDYWPHLVFAISIVAGTGAAVHAAMTKQDVRAAIGWVGWRCFPLFGALFYFVAGINRIRKTRVSQLRDETMVVDAEQVDTLPVDVAAVSGPQFASLKILGIASAGFGCWVAMRCSRWTAGTKPIRP